MQRDLKGPGKLKPADIGSGKWEEIVFSNPVGPAGAIYKAIGRRGNRLVVDLADSAPPALGSVSSPTLFLGLTGISDGNSGYRLVTRYGVVRMSIPGSMEVGDPVYLSQTPGEVSFTPTGQWRIIGTVLETGDDGSILFDGGLRGPAYISGTATVDNDDQVSVPISALGTNIDGLVAGACCLGPPSGTIHVVSCEIAGPPDLVIHLSAAYTGTVGWWVFMQGEVPIAPVAP